MCVDGMRSKTKRRCGVPTVGVRKEGRKGRETVDRRDGVGGGRKRERLGGERKRVRPKREKERKEKERKEE